MQRPEWSFPISQYRGGCRKGEFVDFHHSNGFNQRLFPDATDQRGSKVRCFWGSFRVFLPKVKMFSLLNAPFYFCKLIVRVLGGLESFALPYIDDILLFSLTWESHVIDIAEVLKWLLEASLTVKYTNFKFAMDSVRFLGHEVGSGKRSPTDIKVKTIQKFPTPSAKT